MKHAISTAVLLSLASATHAGNFIPAEGKPIEGQYMVVLNADHPSASARAKALGKLLQGKESVSSAYDKVLKGASSG
jgi:hypothetical protein